MQKILIANRGEIAVRIIRACRDEDLTAVAVYADDDADALHVRLADEAWNLAGTDSSQTYLDSDKLIAIARDCGADAVHPGYGFLSEDADFARAVTKAGLIWIGPTPEAIEKLGNKATARDIAVNAGAPLVPGTDGPVADADAVHAFAREHGLPIIIKAAHGGGGRGMKIVHDRQDIDAAFASATREARSAFGRGECLVERFLDRPRHVEAQVLADQHGHVIVVGTRDCSLQRRNQKLVEEAPAPCLSDNQRQRIHDSARAICRQAGYTSAGTVEYMVGPDGEISFLEVNTRLQVEHPVTEATSGLDLVAEQFRIARGQPLSCQTDPAARGHAIEFRLNAEDPARGFLPFPGNVDIFEAPTGHGIRVDSGVCSGSRIPETYDSLLAKLIITGRDRRQALQRARHALAEMRITGVPTVLPFHQAVLAEPAFNDEARFGVYTDWIEREFRPRLTASVEQAQASDQRRRHRLTIDVDGKAMELGLPARLYSALLQAGQGDTAQADEASASRDSDDGAVQAALNGRLVKWLVEDNSPVAAGAELLVLEAMKMETTLTAPRAGTFRQGQQQPGDQVKSDDVLGHITRTGG